MKLLPLLLLVACAPMDEAARYKREARQAEIADAMHACMARGGIVITYHRTVTHPSDWECASRAW